MNIKQSATHFFTGIDRAEFRKGLECLNAEQLQDLHKQMIRKKIGGGTSMIVGGLAAIPTCGVSLVGTIIGGRRVDVNSDRISMIEIQLKRKGWDGHKKNWKDYALPVALGAVGLGFSTGVEGALIDGMSGGVPAPTDITPPVDGTSGAVPIDHTSSIPTIPGVDSTTPDPPASVFPPPSQIPMDIPDTSVILTDNGIQPAINGIPVGPDYGQVTSSGLFQTTTDPLNPYFPGADNYLNYAGGPPIDPSTSYWPDANQVPLDTQPGIPLLQTDVPYTPNQDILPLDSGYGEAPPDMFPGDILTPDSGYGEAPPGMFPGDILTPDSAYGEAPPGMFPGDATLGTFPPYGMVGLQPSWHDAAGGATATIITTLGSHTIHHGLQSTATAFAHETAKEAAKATAKASVKSLWDTLARGERPRIGHEPGMIPPTPEFQAEFNKLVRTPEWAQFMIFLREREDGVRRERIGQAQTLTQDQARGLAGTNGGNAREEMEGLTKEQRDCLTMLELDGWHVLLGEPKRLRFFIERANGNVGYVKAWIEEYVAGRGR